MLDRREFLAALGVSSIALGLLGLDSAETYQVSLQKLIYASPGGKDLALDLYLPGKLTGQAPVIVFLHGGGWSGGTTTTGPDFRRFFAQDGFAMASIEYRLTPSVTFPSNAEDVKTAIRWLRANADRYSLNPRKIGLWGTSAGGHLAAIAGLSPAGTFEGGGNLDQSSGVQCVLDAYGPSSFDLMDAETEDEKAKLQPVSPALGNAPPMIAGVVAGSPADAGSRPGPPRGPVPHDDPNSAESRLVGAPIQTVPDKVKFASPLTYVRRGAPPFLLMHGLADNSVPYHQSLLLYNALAAAGNDVTLRLVDGLPHTFFNRSNVDDLAGPFRMDVRRHAAGGHESRRVERAGVFDVARAFFAKHLTPRARE
jgi:acetyl esterase/lipase